MARFQLSIVLLVIYPADFTPNLPYAVPLGYDDLLGLNVPTCCCERQLVQILIRLRLLTL